MLGAKGRRVGKPAVKMAVIRYSEQQFDLSGVLWQADFLNRGTAAVSGGGQLAVDIELIGAIDFGQLKEQSFVCRLGIEHKGLAVGGGPVGTAVAEIEALDLSDGDAGIGNGLCVGKAVRSQKLVLVEFPAFGQKDRAAARKVRCADAHNASVFLGRRRSVFIVKAIAGSKKQKGKQQGCRQEKPVSG